MRNVEIKARCTVEDQERIRRILRERDARFVGTDRQTDTYFEVPSGRLKLREGPIENALIFYERPDQQGPKTSQIELYRTEPESGLGAVLRSALSTAVVVRKEREIYFIDHVKFHLDRVEDLGRFVEIEVIDREEVVPHDELRSTCAQYLSLFGLDDQALVAASYSDLLSSSS